MSCVRAHLARGGLEVERRELVDQVLPALEQRHERQPGRRGTGEGGAARRGRGERRRCRGTQVRH